MTYQAILVGSAILILAFGIERIGRALCLPSVVLLVCLGLVGKPLLSTFNVAIPALDAVVPVIGAVGLVLIVLEGALDIELKRERLQSALGALIMAGSGFLAVAIPLCAVIVFALPLNVFQSLLLAVPFAVISSAVAIPSSHFLSPHGREFVVYESSVSDILGVMVFFSLIGSDGTLLGALRSLTGGGLLSLLLAIICALALTLIMLRIDGHIRFVPLLAGMFGLYSIGKLMHLSPLIMVLLFGLALNNTQLITRFKPFRNWLDKRYAATLYEFKLLTAEMTFAVRGFFFILLGYWTDLSTLAMAEAWIGAGLILLIIYGSRLILLQLTHADSPQCLIWLAPRGLITVLLFLSAKTVLPIPGYFDGVVMLVVLISAMLTALARLRWQGDPASATSS